MYISMNQNKFIKIKKNFEEHGGIIESSFERRDMIMFEITNINAIKIRDILSIAGEKSGDGKEQLLPLKIGSLLSDGDNIYEVSGIPFVRYITTEAMKKNICVQIKPADIDPAKLNGKTLRLIQN